MGAAVYAITGAFGALGAAVTEAAGRLGARLALIDLEEAPPAHLRVPQTALLLGGTDLTDPGSAQSAIDAIVERWGRLDVLINLAGGFRWETHEAGDADTWRQLFIVNVQTAANISRAAIPALRQSQAGRIVNVGALAAVRAAAGMAPYAASKEGVHKLTEALAEELKRDGVTVNAVLPSILDTPANRAAMPTADFSSWVTPDDLASVILFLASEQARAVTGALLPVAGRA